MLDTKLKPTRFVRLECKKAAEKSIKANIIGRQAVMHAMNAGREMTKIKLLTGLKGAEWNDYCHAHFKVKSSTARSYMFISKIFHRPDEIPDNIRSIRSALKAAARVSKDIVMRGQLPPGWKSMEKVVTGRICYTWNDDPLKLEDDSGEWGFWSAETRCGRVNADGTETPGACDILFKRNDKLEWLIVEVKSQKCTGKKELEQLLDYMRSFRQQEQGKLFGVLVCENPSQGLRAAAAKAGIIVRTYSLDFQK